MKLIPLSLQGKNKGKFTIIDDEDFDLVNQYRWYYRGGYAIGHLGNQKQVILSRFLMGNPKGKMVDHINHDTLDNRRQNLRIATKFQNMQNQLKYRGGSKYKGVSKMPKPYKNMWRAQIACKYIGYFKEERHAAMAYDIWAKELFGEFAVLNFKRIGD